MQKGNGLRRYLYEFMFARSVEEARAQTSETLPISQCKALRADLEARLVAQQTSMADPALGAPAFMEALNQSLGEASGHRPFDLGKGVRDEAFVAWQSEFVTMTAVGANATAAQRRAARLPISPYDPRWADRESVRALGIELGYLPDVGIDKATGGLGSTASLEAPETSRQLNVYRASEKKAGQFEKVGPGLTAADASGLTRLASLMSAAEFAAVKSWVINGARDAQGRIDLSKYASTSALDRSVAVLTDLRERGVAYEIQRDRRVGQIKARLRESGVEIRLTDTRANDNYVGARAYDNGTEYYFTTNRRVAGGKPQEYTPTPAEAVELVRFASGEPVQRADGSGHLVGSTAGEYTERSGRNEVTVPGAYRVGKSLMSVYKNLDEAGRWQVKIKAEQGNRSLPKFFAGAEMAEEYITESVTSARANFRSQLDVERLIEAYDTQAAEALGVENQEFIAPEFSTNTEVAAIQRAYWDVLTGERDALLRPGADMSMFRQALADGAFEESVGNLAYTGPAREQIAEHADELVDELIGTAEVTERYEQTSSGTWHLVERSFDPARVVKYMTSTSGEMSNLESLAAAMRAAGRSGESLMGDGFTTARFRDRLLTFDERTASTLDELMETYAQGSEQKVFLEAVSATLHETFASNATVVNTEDILADANGVVSWSGHKIERSGRAVEVSGEIGQVFVRGEHGEIVTKFASDDNALIVPGYEARIVAPKAGEPWTSLEERTRLVGYQQVMCESLRRQLRADLLSERTQVGTTTSLNGVYGRLYGTKHPVDLIEQSTYSWPATDPATGEVVGDYEQLDPWVAATLATEACRVRFGNEFKEGSTLFAERSAQLSAKHPADDNSAEVWDLTGRNMLVLGGRDEHGVVAPGGYFDPMMTGGGANQGIVRYLPAAATVDAEGRIVPGATGTDADRRAPLMLREELASLVHDPFDRQQMATSAILQGSGVTEPTRTALMTFGGWGADDGIVVSAEFAHREQIRGSGGRLRPLMIGDKISDLHGNKGVISLVVDRTMSDAEAEAAGLATEVAWFRANPDLDVVMSPFSLISRRNAGAARELMFGEVKAINVPDGVEVDDLMGQVDMGQARFVITHLPVDEKTKIYDEDEVRAGRGRKASSQLAWALQAAECGSIMKEFYGHNTLAESSLREYLLSTGLDMEADGSLRVVGESMALSDAPARRVLEMQPLVVRTNANTGAKYLNVEGTNRGFADLIASVGGDMELPFPLTYPTGQSTETTNLGTWRLPVLSSALRSGQEFEDGRVSTHDYTRRYVAIHGEGAKWRFAKEQLDNEPEMAAEKRDQLRATMGTAQARAQRDLDAINNDIIARRFASKNNVFKTQVMSSRLPDSATMVWTADPRLRLDEVAMSSATAAELNLSEGDKALIWRDPILRDSCVRYMWVRINDELTGVAVNPVVAPSFDGDFDGDAVAVVKLHTDAAKREAEAKFGFGAHLLDTGAVREDGLRPLSTAVSLDTKVALARNPELVEEFDSALVEVNRVEREWEQFDSETAAERTEISDRLEGRVESLDNSEDLIGREGDLMQAGAEVWAETQDARADLVRELDGLYRASQRAEFGSGLRLSDDEAHLDSIRQVCVATGAKGSDSKLAEYTKNLGARLGEPDITQADQEQTMYAAGMKAHATGLGGSFSQRAVRALRGGALKSVLEVTYPVTQSVLQAKHDAVEAKHKYEMLCGAGRDLWRGRLVERLGGGAWSRVYDREAGTGPVQATREEWVAQMRDFYTSADGFNVHVDPAHIEAVAGDLVDPATGLMRNLEEEPALEGCLLDQLTYSDNNEPRVKFEAMVAAARERRSIYEGPRAVQFAPAPTREAIRQVDRLEARLGGEVDVVEAALDGAALDEPVVSTQVLKSDVHVEGTARGANRRSASAVAVRRPMQFDLVPSYGPGAGDEGSEHESGEGYEW